MALGLTLDAPPGGETLHPGDRVHLRWSAEGAEQFAIECALDGGEFASIATVGATTFDYLWTIPATLLGESTRRELRVRVVAKAGEEQAVAAIERPFEVVLSTVSPPSTRTAPPPPARSMEAPPASLPASSFKHALKRTASASFAKPAIPANNAAVDRPPPSIAAIDPRFGPVTGGTAVAVSGANFHPFSVARVGGKDAATKFQSPASLHVITPPGNAPGFADLDVMNPDTRTAKAPNAFRYDAVPAPTIASVDPKSGSVVGGNAITLVGKNFTPRTVVTIGGERPHRTTFVDAQTLEIVAPPARGDGMVDLAAKNPDGQIALARNAYRYEAAPAPTIETVSPRYGFAKGGETLTIVGKHLGPRTVVEIGGAPARSTTLVAAGTIEAVTPPNNAGALVDVVVKNPDGQRAVMPRAFQYR